MSNLDLSLDNIIENSARAPNYGPVPTRRFNNRSAGRATPYSFPKERAAETRWSDSMLAEERAAAAFYPIQGGARNLVLETGTKLLISNLDYGVSDLDINICKVLNMEKEMNTLNIPYLRCRIRSS